LGSDRFFGNGVEFLRLSDIDNGTETYGSRSEAKKADFIEKHAQGYRLANFSEATHLMHAFFGEIAYQTSQDDSGDLDDKSLDEFRSSNLSGWLKYRAFQSEETSYLVDLFILVIGSTFNSKPSWLKPEMQADFVFEPFFHDPESELYRFGNAFAKSSHRRTSEIEIQSYDQGMYGSTDIGSGLTRFKYDQSFLYVKGEADYLHQFSDWYSEAGKPVPEPITADVSSPIMLISSLCFMGLCVFKQRKS
jgi:hypothetical protein